MFLAKWYTRIIGVFFILVIVSLLTDYAQFGFRPETMHKILHVLWGIVILIGGWKNDIWWKTFPLANGAFFMFVAVFGALFPDFGGLDAFNTTDTILHSLVGITGLSIGILSLSSNPFFKMI